MGPGQRPLERLDVPLEDEAVAPHAVAARAGVVRDGEPRHGPGELVAHPRGSLIAAGFLRADTADPRRFQIVRKLRIAYPADPQNAQALRAGGHLPVVVLVHGNHAVWDGTRHVPNHEGYTYLQDELARHGIVAVSVDTNVANAVGSLIEMRAESVLGALDALRAMDHDAASRFHGRLDFGKVGMMGYSRGGDAVVRAAALNLARPAASRYGVAAVCALAPTDFTGTVVPGSALRLDTSHAGFFLVLYGAPDLARRAPSRRERVHRRPLPLATPRRFVPWPPPEAYALTLPASHAHWSGFVAMKTLGTTDIFKDITGLALNQANSAASRGSSMKVTRPEGTVEVTAGPNAARPPLDVDFTIVTAVHGDGKADGTAVTLADSATGTFVSEPFTEFAMIRDVVSLPASTTIPGPRVGCPWRR